MGSRNTHFKYGPGLLLNKQGCIIDTVGYANPNLGNCIAPLDRCNNTFEPCNPCNPCECKYEPPTIENKSNKFQCQLANQVQNIFGGGGCGFGFGCGVGGCGSGNGGFLPLNDPNMLNIVDKIQSFENDLFMPFMQPFSTFCPQPFDTPVLPPFAMPRPLPCAQQEFLMPFSNFCKQTYPKIQSDPSLLPQIFTPFTQMLLQNSLPTKSIGPQFPPINSSNQFFSPQNVSSQYVPPSNISNQLPTNTNKQLNLPSLSQYNPQSVAVNQFNLPTAGLNQFNTQSTGMNQLNAYNMQLYPFGQLNTNIPNSQPTMTQNYNKTNLHQPIPNSFLSKYQQNIAQNQNFPSLSTHTPATGFFPIQTESGFQSNINAPFQNGFQFLNYPFQQTQPNFFSSQFPNINNIPTNSIMEHISQVMINQPIQRTNFFSPYTPAQKQFKEQMAQVNLIPSTSNFKPIHIENQNQNQNPLVQFIVPSNPNIDSRNTQPFDQQTGLPNVANALNIVRDSLGPRPIPHQSFDNSFANPFLSLHSLISQQQPMNEPFAQSIEFLMNSG